MSAGPTIFDPLVNMNVEHGSGLIAIGVFVMVKNLTI
jgi:hypothetical protein